MNTKEKLAAAFDRAAAATKRPERAKQWPSIVLETVPRYEGYPITLDKEEDGTVSVCAVNEGGHNGTAVDLAALIDWLKTNMPEALE